MRNRFKNSRGQWYNPVTSRFEEQESWLEALVGGIALVAAIFVIIILASMFQ